jgi:alanine-glyoxylate transaminase/serine-glyoxylate transaminase/serine-pyruvate transaminase
MVDSISGLGSVEYDHDGWGVDVTVCCSQKGLMLPPGLGFNAISEKALAASKSNSSIRSYWDWHEVLNANKSGSWSYTPATNLLYGLKEAVAMLLEEGLDNVFARHKRYSAATRAAVAAWGLENLCQDPREYSPILTAVVMPEGMTPISSARSRSRISTCRSARGWARSRARSSASATSVISTI